MVPSRHLLFILFFASFLSIANAASLTNNLPIAINLNASGTQTPSRGTDVYPALSWTFSDADGDVQQGWEIQAEEWSPVKLASDPVGNGTSYLSGKVINPDPIYTLSKTMMGLWGSRTGSYYRRAAGTSHAYKWRIRLYDGKEWGTFSQWLTYLHYQAPSMPQNVAIDSSSADLIINLAPVLPQSGKIIYVNANGGNDANNGLTLGNAVATINRSLAIANPGDTILVYPGVYNEKVVIKKSVNPKLVDITLKGVIDGENKAIISGEQLAAGPAVNVASDGVTFENLTVIKTNLNTGYPSSITATGSNNKVRNNILDAGISMESGGITSKNCLVNNNKVVFSETSTGSVYGIVVSCDGTDIIGNDISGIGGVPFTGIRVSRDSIGANIVGNRVDKLGIPVYLM